ncbi:MAG: SURF1 family protein, partial [Chloroflexota bacterium]|nr:SURF1 family protein [Chloroflexota bacterium]
LGIWQLDRLEARRAFNAQVQAMRAMPPLNLDQGASDTIQDMEWRAVQLRGHYDFENQIAIRNQYYGGQYGYHLLTPLLFDGTAVLVDRGWIPADGNSAPDDWRKYDEVGEVNLSGQVRLGQGKPAIGGVADALPENGARLEIWNNADVARIAGQLPYPSLPVYIQLDADAQDTEPPIPFQPEIELTEGPHFGYALQWFTFATILFVGYPFYLQKQETVTT